MKDQLRLPGLESPEAKQNRPKANDQVQALEKRILALELEVSLLRIQIEKGEK